MRLALTAPFIRLPRRAPRASQAPATVVARRGALAALLGPVGVACALLVVGIPTVAIWNIRTASDARNAAHDAPAPRDATTAGAAASRKVADGETEFVLRLVDGRLVRVIAGKDAVTDTLNRAILALDAARIETKRQSAEGLDRLFAGVFDTRDADIAAYADWYYDWGRSWRLLYEAVTGAGQEAVRLSFSQTQVTDAARFAVEAYLLRHYQDYVLKPALRDEAIAAGSARVLGDARGAYVAAAAALDDRLQRFLAEEARHAEEIPATMAVRVDWDAARWRAPTTGAEDRYLDPVASAAFVGGGAVLGTLVQRAALPFLARATAQVMVTAEATLGGAAAGSIQPGLGTAIGALAGLAIDWGLSEFREYMERDAFIAGNNAALDATIATWKGRIGPEIDRAIDVWFDDARATVAAQAPE